MRQRRGVFIGNIGKDQLQFAGFVVGRCLRHLAGEPCRRVIAVANFDWVADVVRYPPRDDMFGHQRVIIQPPNPRVKIVMNIDTIIPRVTEIAIL